MKKAIWRVVFMFFVVALCLASFIAGLQHGVYWTEAVLAQDVAPKLGAEQRAEIAQLQKKTLELLIRQQQIQKRYQDALNADPQFKALSSQKDDVDSKLQTLITAVTKDVDQKKWRFDAEALTFEPVTPEKGDKK